MPGYRRPSLVAEDQIAVSEHLLAKGIHCSTRRDATAMIIDFAGTSNELTAALADYAPTGQPYRAPLPGDLPTHAQHLVSYLNATPAQIAALTQAQKDHVLQDCIRALRWFLDDRLGT